ncbi:hypothetical protein [Leisingera thetidis]|uniref:hypothetical protein n=1 Tax=Leisingera thetidis TaxID=2930199 RepID=UPI0021F6A837|nr:hypothetical protein [Leisingera thetidis]
MHKPLALTLACALVLAGCGGWQQSRINPSNWFGGSEPAETAAAANSNPLLPQDSNARGIFARPEPKDNTVLVTRVSELRIERTASGAIIHATAIAGRQGAYDVELRPAETPEDGVLAYDFRVVYPEFQTGTGSEFSRTLHAARTVSYQDLEGIRTVRVNAAQNAQESRRR